MTLFKQESSLCSYWHNERYLALIFLSEPPENSEIFCECLIKMLAQYEYEMLVSFSTFRKPKTLYLKKWEVCYKYRAEEKP